MAPAAKSVGGCCESQSNGKGLKHQEEVSHSFLNEEVKHPENCSAAADKRILAWTLPKVVPFAYSSHYLIFSHQMPRSRDKENRWNGHFRHVTKGKIKITQQWQLHNGAIITYSACLYLLSCQMCFIQLLYGEEIPPQPEPSAIMLFGTSELVTGIQSPRWCRWVNWFSALRSPIRLESTQEEDESC